MMRGQSRPLRGAGFSLIETLCGILVLGVAVVALTQSITAALRSTRSGVDHSRAALLAAERMELLFARRYLPTTEVEGEFEVPDDQFGYRESVEEIEPEGLHEITVEIIDLALERPVFELVGRRFVKPFDGGLYGSGSYGSGGADDFGPSDGGSAFGEGSF